MIVQRYLCLLVPVVATLLAAHVDRNRQARAAALLAFVAAAVGVAALHEVAVGLGWYAFAPVDGAYRGLPVDLWWGWAALWGPVPVLLRRHLPLPVAVGLLLWVDVVTMPHLAPLLRLGPHWIAGEALGLLAVVVPVQLLGRWTADRQRLVWRTLLQVGLVAAVLLWLLPTVAFTLGGGGWHQLTRLPRAGLLMLAQVALLVAVPGLLAVREFVTRGGGTPYPWDPPTRLVTSGPYAYVGNPMQISAVLLLLLAAAATRSATLAAGALLTAAFAVGVAAPHERHDLHGRYADGWRHYRRHVGDWWPRRRPYDRHAPGRLWLDDGCGPCAATLAFLHRRRPHRLALRSAAELPHLRRAWYESADGHTASGVGAVARGLEHLSLGWAYVGWVLRLPGVDRLAQLIIDALIVAPHHPADRNRA